MKFRSLVAFIALSIAAVTAAQAPQGRHEKPACATMLDVSGSMDGFYGATADLPRLVRALAQQCDEHVLLGTNARWWAGALEGAQFDPAAARGGFKANTLLGTALETWLAGSTKGRLLILTDNVADGSGVGAAAQRHFYDLLGTPASGFTHISVLIFRLPFKGKVWAPGIDEPGEYPVAGAPPAPRALTLYVLERHGSAGDEAFRAETEATLRSLGFSKWNERDAPLERDYAVARLLKFQPGIDVQVGEIAGGRHVSIQTDRTEKVDRIQVSRGATDEPTTFTLRLRKVNTGPHWNFGDAPFKAVLHFPKDGDFGRAIDQQCDVTPKGPGRGAGRVLDEVNLSCTVPPVWHDVPADKRDKLAAAGDTWRAGTLTLRIEAQERDLTLEGPLQRFFGMAPDLERDPDALRGDNPEVHRNVYQLGELLKKMVPPGETAPVVKTYALQVRFRSPVWEFLGKLVRTGLPWGLSALALVLVVWLLTRPASYRAIGTTETEPVRLRFAQQRSLRTLNAVPVSLILWGPFITLAAGGQKKFLGRAGGMARIAGDTGAAETIKLVPTSRARTAPRERRGAGRIKPTRR